MSATSNKFSRVDLYELGHEEIDREHRAIYDALEAMWRTVPPDAIPELLENARIATRKHFEHEHLLMKIYNYPFLESHLEIHEVALKSFLNTINYPTTENLQELVDEFLNHILLYDSLFVDWIKSEQHRRSTDDRHHEVYR